MASQNDITVPYSLRLTQQQLDKMFYIRAITGLTQNDLIRRFIDAGIEAWVEKHMPPVGAKKRKIAAVLFERPDWVTTPKKELVEPTP